jgi:hypothetical protein
VSADLDNAIAAYEKAIRLIGPDSPPHPASLIDKANALCTRYEILASDDIGGAIEKGRGAGGAGG